MSRMTRTQWEDRNRRMPDKSTLQRALWREVRRRLLADGVISRRPPKGKSTWFYDYDGRQGQVLAHTRSDARAEVKRITGSKKLHLPLVLYVADDSGAVSQ